MSRKERPEPAEGKKKRAPGAFKRRLAFVFMIVFLILILAVSAVKIHETFILPAARADLNAKSLAQIKKDYVKYDKEFLNPDPKTHGHTVIVWGDNHSSVHTFSKLIEKINADNATYRRQWAQSMDKLKEVQNDKSMPADKKAKKIAELTTDIDESHKMQVLFTINVGDLAYDGDATKYRMTLEISDKVNVPMVTAIGNHDIRSNGRAVYSKMFGPFYYSFAVGDTYYIVLDDANEKRVDPAQMKWLKSELDKSVPYKHCLVLMHVPPFKGKQNPNAPMTKFLADRKNAEELKELAQKYHINFMVAGHIHTYDATGWPTTGGPLVARMPEERQNENYTDLIISGGAGARLWKVDQDKDDVMSRAEYHYFRVFLNGLLGEQDAAGNMVWAYRTGFNRETIKVPNADHFYTMEEIRICIYAKIANLYWWEMLVLVPIFLALAAWLWFDRRRRKAAGAPQ